MAIDHSVSTLLCAEENNIILYDDFDNGVVEEFDEGWEHINHRMNSQNESFISEEYFSIGLAMQSDDCLALMLKCECEHLPASDYLQSLKNGDLDFEAREDAIDWIRKAHAHFSFGPLCLYLSMNYMDRFLSAYELPKGKSWMMQLLAVACLSIAAKMEETEVPLCLDLQVAESKYVFEARTIKRMELLVLSILKWRMQAVTPFSFIDYFLKLINGDQMPSRSLIFISTQLILSTIKGIDFLKFRPSEIAAAVAISVGGETQTVDTENAIYVLTQHVEKGRLVKCIELLHDLSLLSGSVKGLNSSVPSVPQSPIGVLDSAFLSCKTDDTPVGSCANSSHSSPDTKRRKLNGASEVEL